MFEQTFKNIDDILPKDAGCGSELALSTSSNPTSTNPKPLRSANCSPN
jgi:hypothetical protein